MLASSRLLAGFLFGLEPNDPFTLLATAALLALVSLLAGLIPAARLDPVTALREDG